MALGFGPSLDAGTARAFVIGLAVAQGTQQKPQIKNHTCPARGQLDPERGVTPMGEGGLQDSSLVTGGQNVI